MTSQFTVEDTFLIKGRGLIVVGRMDDARHGFRIGARVRVSRPGGTELTNSVRGTEVLRHCFSEGVSIAVLLHEAVAKEEVPRGSVVTLEKDELRD